MKEKELENTRDKINEAFVAFKIGKITELEKDIVIKGYVEKYADWKIKKCLPKEVETKELYYEEDGIRKDYGPAFFNNGFNQCRKIILSNKDKK